MYRVPASMGCLSASDPGQWCLDGSLQMTDGMKRVWTRCSWQAPNTAVILASRLQGHAIDQMTKGFHRSRCFVRWKSRSSSSAWLRTLKPIHCSALLCATHAADPPNGTTTAHAAGRTISIRVMCSRRQILLTIYRIFLKEIGSDRGH